MSRGIVALRVALALLGIFVLLALYLGVRGMLAANHLKKASDRVSRVQQEIEKSLTSGTVPKGVIADATTASGDTSSAASLTNDPVWKAAGHLPLVGKYFDSTRRAAKAADLVVSQAVQPALEAAQLIIPVRKQIHDGTIPLDPFIKSQPLLEDASTAMLQAKATIDPARKTGVLLIDKPLLKLRTEIDKLAPRLDDAQRASKLLPTMAGNNGVRRYFVGFLTNAESRTQGGLLGSYGILRAEKGKLRFESFGSDADLQDASKPVVTFDQEFTDNYNATEATTSWRDSPQIAYYPQVANVWVNLWKAQHNEQLDGAFMTDPVALSYVLSVIGPAKLPSGEVIDAANIVEKAENTSYIRYTKQQQRRDYLKAIFKAASEKFINTKSPDAKVFSKVGEAITEGRLKMWSARASEQRVVTGSPLEGATPAPGSPLAWATFNNALGNKMDYYLKRTMIYTPAACGQGAKIELDLSTIDSVAGLPPYIVQSANPHVQDQVSGADSLETTVYVDGGQLFQSVTLDGQPYHLRQYTERGLTGLATNLVVKPGQTVKMVIQLVPPKHPGRVRIVQQPMVIPQKTFFANAPTC